VMPQQGFWKGECDVKVEPQGVSVCDHTGFVINKLSLYLAYDHALPLGRPFIWNVPTMSDSFALISCKARNQMSFWTLRELEGSNGSSVD